CAATGNNFVFHPDGRLFACGQDMGMGRSESHIGRYFPELELDDLIISRWQSRSVVNMPACLRCPVGLLHAGGCANLSMRYGNNSLHDPYCEEFPERLAACVDFSVRKWLGRRTLQPTRVVSA
ncbi:MAG: SPASM domain-containing protein, partial [Candidatus Eremiobacteraeota bacterium]|nr:SPASM domain-containing protein [Candidatus Eremiobacteraeota bacterium]